MSGQVDEWISERINRSFLVPRKVRFLAMIMFEQARRCSFGLTKTFISSCSDLNASVLTEEHKKHKEVVFPLF